jgi:integrase
LRPNQLSAAHILEVTHELDHARYALATRVIRLVKFRKLLRWLWENHGAPKLDGYVPRYPGLRPRNVTATRAQIDALEAKASPALNLMLLMCSDLGIRSGTAVKLRPENYDRETGELRFSSKKGSKICLPVTEALREVLESLDRENPLPYLTQIRVKTNPNAARNQEHEEMDPQVLRRELTDLLKQLGINKRLVLHDFRRSAAVALYRRTKDLRIVQAFLGHRSIQATIWYLDHELVPVDRADLEAIKKPFIAWRKEA